MHTPLCGHAVGEPEEYVRQAAAQGIDLITFTCHVPMLEEGFSQKGIRMKDTELPLYVNMVERARELGEELGVRVLCGIEAEIYPDEGMMKRMDATIARHDFDFVLGSLHASLPIYRDWLKQHGKFTDYDIVEDYFTLLTEAIPTKRYDSFAHPDVIRMYGVVKKFEPAKHEASIRKFLQTAYDYDQCLEVNTSGLTKGDFTLHPDPIILDWATEIGNRFTIGSDSHRPESVGQKFKEVFALLECKGIKTLDYYVGRQRHTLAKLPVMPGH